MLDLVLSRSSLNEKGEILLIQEGSVREGQDKQGKWSLVYETGKVGETPEQSLLAGIRSELGLEILKRLKQLENRTFGFDFRRFDGDRPSRSLISVFTLPANQLTVSSKWGSEVSDTRWISVQDLLNLPETELRIKVKAIVKELNSRKLLTTSVANISEVYVPPQITAGYLLSREKIPDLFWE